MGKPIEIGKNKWISGKQYLKHIRIGDVIGFTFEGYDTYTKSTITGHNNSRTIWYMDTYRDAYYNISDFLYPNRAIKLFERDSFH